MLLLFLALIISLLEVTVYFDSSTSSLSSLYSSLMIFFFGTFSADTIKFLDACLHCPNYGLIFVACLKNVVFDEQDDPDCKLLQSENYIFLIFRWAFRLYFD